MIRAPFAVLGAIAFTGFMSALCIPMFIFWGNRSKQQQFIRVWATGILKLFNIYVDVIGIENLNDKGGIILFNHISLFDIPIMMSVFPKVMRFGAKIELFRIPIFGQALRIVGTLPIARERRAEVMRVYAEAQSRVENGESFALAPEGGRRKTPGIGPFKSGPFIFAINAKVPVFPVVIKGAYQILPKGAILPCRDTWSTTVQVVFLPALPTKDISLDDRYELRQKVLDQMTEVFLKS